MSEDVLGCLVCLKKYPGKKYWQQSKLLIEFLTSAHWGHVCPDCQKLVGSDYKIVNRFFEAFRQELIAKLPPRGAEKEKE